MDEGHILGVHWEDVLFKSLLPLLPLADLFRLRAASRDCQVLVETYFAQCRRLMLHPSTAATISAEAFEIMTANVTRLRWLDLTGCKILNNEMLMPLLANNPHLEHVDLSECKHLTIACLQELAVCANKLRRLILKNCPFVTGGSIESMAHHQPHLISLNLTGCWQLADSSVANVFKECPFPEIRYLSLCNVFTLTDTTMLEIANKLRGLMALDIRMCWRITNCGVNAVGENCQNLKVLWITQCPNVTEESLHPLRQRNVQIDRAP